MARAAAKAKTSKKNLKSKAKTTKKSVAKKAKSTTKRRRAAKAEIKPVKNVYTKNAMMAKIAEKAELQPRDVKKVFELWERLVLGSIHPKGLGEFAMSGLFKIVTKKVPAKKMPAIKKGTPVRNPSTGEMMPSKGRAAFTKPATVRVKVRALAKLKRAGIGEA